jgi:hypothetical protein
MSSSNSEVEAAWSPLPGVSPEIDGGEFFTKIFKTPIRAESYFRGIE